MCLIVWNFIDYWWCEILKRKFFLIENIWLELKKHFYFCEVALTGELAKEVDFSFYMCCGIKFVKTEEWNFLSLGRNKVQTDFFPDLCQYWPVIWGGKNSDLRPVPLIDLCVPTVTSAVVIQTWNVYWLQIQADLLTTWQVRPLRCCRKGVPFFQHLLMSL